jgi:hypothetical protein
MVNNQATVNFMQAIKGAGAKAPVVLETVPGLVVRATCGDGAVRSSQMVASKIRAAATENELYGVYGTKLVAQTESAGNINVGTLNANPGRVQIARGRQYIALVDGTDGYTYDGTTFTQIADPDFPGNTGAGSPTFILYLDGYFIVNDALTDNFFISAVENPTSWNALDFDAASVAPDNALALAEANSLLWIFGDETSQAYYNSGNPDFPYQIVLSATQEVGVLAPQSMASGDDGIFFLATTPQGGRFVYQIRGQSGQTISGDEQEDFLTTVTDPTDAYGFIYKQAGKSFYILQLSDTTGADPRTSSTLIYNIKAQAWETREQLDGTGWRAGSHGVLGNKNVVGSRIDAQNLDLDLDEYQDAGQAMIRRRRCQIVHNMNKLLDFWSLIVDVQGGVGTAVAAGANPQLKMRYSDDGGQNWSDFLIEEVGRIGQTMKRCVFDQLGISRNRIFEIELSEAVNLTIMGAYVEISELDN